MNNHDSGPTSTAATGALEWKALPAGEHGFFRAPVLLTGAREAVLIDGGFSLPDGRAVVEAIRASGKTLTTVYVSQSDPDYYFSLGPIQAAFPDAKIVASRDTIAAIQANVEKKLAVWGPQLKENGPQTLADIVMPEPFDAPALELEGHAIEIIPAEGLSNRRYLWVPSLQAVFGGVLVFSGLHIWTADTSTPEARAAWVRNLESIAARKPAVVVPGHMTVDGALDATAVAYIRRVQATPTVGLTERRQRVPQVTSSVGFSDGLERNHGHESSTEGQVGSQVPAMEVKHGRQPVARGRKQWAAPTAAPVRGRFWKQTVTLHWARPGKGDWLQ